MAGGDGWRKGRWACEIFTRLTYVEWVVSAIIPIWKQTHLVKITLIHSPINTVEFLIPKKKFFALFSFLVVFIIFISRAVFIEKCFQFKKRVFFSGVLNPNGIEIAPGCGTKGETVESQRRRQEKRSQMIFRLSRDSIECSEWIYLNFLLLSSFFIISKI